MDHNGHGAYFFLFLFDGMLFFGWGSFRVSSWDATRSMKITVAQLKEELKSRNLPKRGCYIKKVSYMGIFGNMLYCMMKSCKAMAARIYKTRGKLICSYIHNYKKAYYYSMAMAHAIGAANLCRSHIPVEVINPACIWCRGPALGPCPTGDGGQEVR